MAQLLDKVYLSFPITKSERTADGDLLVWGKASDGSLDSDEQIVDQDFSGKALEDWLSTGGNVRVMHSSALYPAGKGVELDKTEDGHWVRSLVVEPTAKMLVQKGVLQAYSVGIANPKIVRDSVAKGGRVVDGRIVEISLVDRPANKNCGIQLVKSDSGGTAVQADELFGRYEELLKSATDDAATENVEAPDVTKDQLDEDVDDVEDEAPDVGDDVTKSADAPADLSELYATARHDWLSREPTVKGAVDGTEYLAKRSAWMGWHYEGEHEGLDGTPAGREKWLAKRDMDPNVGGGVDRDKLKPGDFVDPENRRFPVVTPGDVSDAVSSYGRMGAPKIPFDDFKARVTALARRKGPRFVAALPDSWDVKKSEGGSAVTTATIEAVTEVAETSELVKGMKDCPSCGKAYHADSKQRTCENCGGKLPVAKADTPDGDGDADDVNDPDDDPVEKKRGLPADVKPAGRHREPDGDYIEALEEDAGIVEPGEGTDPVPDKIPASVGKTSQADSQAAPQQVAPYVVKRMHDVACAAYHADDVYAEYPALKSLADGVDTAWWTTAVAAAATKGDLDATGELVVVARSAQVIKAADTYALLDAHAHLHKSFTDLYPDTRVTPSEVTPGRFTRPYITAGHSPLTASSSASPRVPVSSHVPEPQDFHRGPITTGHEADSPANKGDDARVPVGSGTVSASARYSAAAKANARAALENLHDHIACDWPDVCPMATTKSTLPPDMQATAVPQPVAEVTVAAARAVAPGEKTTTADLPKTAHREAATETSGAGANGAAPAPDLNTLIKTQLTKALTEALGELRGTYETEIAALRTEIAALGALPDPAQAPARGVAVKSQGDALTPVERRSLAGESQATPEVDEHTQYRQYLEKLADPRANGNTVQREQARAVLDRMLTTPLT